MRSLALVTVGLALTLLASGGGPVPCEVLTAVAAPQTPKKEREYKETDLAETGPAVLTTKPLVLPLKPVGQADPPTIDQLIKQLADLRKQKAEIEKQEKATLAELKTRLDVIRDLLNELNVDPVVPPAPKPPEPKPPTPQPPQPVTSFRVIYVFESAKTLTAAQNSVIHGQRVSNYLKAATTPEGGLPGFRRFDKDFEAGNETPTVKALWATVKPQITAVPAVVIEVNSKATIEPLPATEAEAVALFKKYSGK